jgi:hypothetical protein
MQVFTGVFLGRTGSYLSALLLVLMVSILIQISGKKSVTLWNRPWKNSLPPNRWLTLPGSPHSWVEQALTHSTLRSGVENWVISWPHHLTHIFGWQLYTLIDKKCIYMEHNLFPLKSLSMPPKPQDPNIMEWPQPNSPLCWMHHLAHDPSRLTWQLTQHNGHGDWPFHSTWRLW